MRKPVPMIRKQKRSARSADAVIARRMMAIVLVAVVAGLQPAAAATINVTAERHGETVEIHASALLNAEAATAWRVLTDYGRYAEFVPDLRESRVVARRGATIVVEQSGDARLWLLRMPLDIKFEITESAPHGVHSRAVAGSLRALESSYVLTPAPHGVYLEYTGHVTPGFELFGALEQYAVEQNITRQFQALADEIERIGAAGR